jgi:hypothetical protein
LEDSLGVHYREFILYVKILEIENELSFSEKKNKKSHGTRRPVSSHPTGSLKEEVRPMEWDGTGWDRVVAFH